MASYYFVKSGGTATGNDGRKATIGSGSFATLGASNYYNSIEEARDATTAPVSGDFILCSHLHNFSTTSDNNILTTMTGLAIISVDDANRNQYLAGATESATNTGSTLETILACTSNAYMSFIGMHFFQDSNFILMGDSAHYYFDNCIIEFRTGGNASAHLETLSNNDGIRAYFKDCDLDFGHAAQSVGLGDNCLFIFDGCINSGATNNNFFDQELRGGSAICRNMDMTKFGSTLGLVLSTDSGDGHLGLLVENCHLATGTVLILNANDYNHDLVFSGSGEADEYFNYERLKENKTVIIDTATYLNATYDGGTTGFSMKLSTHTFTDQFQPLRYRLGILSDIDLSTAQTVTVEITSDAGLTDNDVWIEITIQDNTDQALGVTQTTQNADIMATGTGLTTAGTGTWTVGDTEDYIITKDLGAQSNVLNGNVEVWICVGKISTDVFADMPLLSDT